MRLRVWTVRPPPPLVSRAFIVAGEEGILSCQGKRADQTFHGIGGNFDAAITEKVLQAVPVPVDTGVFPAEDPAPAPGGNARSAAVEDFF
ncbi:hypothetical protein SAMN05216236_12745 [Sedimentitalea nanhaiensis]|uniref:Uncharacterized protein n=1 Tax=Sedimentitalea nanhaiensis TaxID=999627 RepID=A0A1I7DFW2_9RHOB|nr:hypothetical protein SAMN05216236_12745 [Sedimentitalea nanhaiensis]